MRFVIPRSILKISSQHITGADGPRGTRTPRFTKPEGPTVAATRYLSPIWCPADACRPGGSRPRASGMQMPVYQMNCDMMRSSTDWCTPPHEEYIFQSVASRSTATILLSRLQDIASLLFDGHLIDWMTAYGVHAGGRDLTVIYRLHQKMNLSFLLISRWPCAPLLRYGLGASSYRRGSRASKSAATEHLVK